MPVLEDTDGEVFNAVSKQVFVTAGDANAELGMNPATPEKIELIAPGGSPEFLVLDGAGNLFVNIHDKNQIVKIDTKRDMITARLNLPGCDKPTRLAIDALTGGLFSSCQNSKLIVLNSKNGETIALLPIGQGSDTVRFDPVDHLIFKFQSRWQCFDYPRSWAAGIRRVAPLKTVPGARTMEIDPKTGNLFLVTADILSVGLPTAPGHCRKFTSMRAP